MDATFWGDAKGDATVLINCNDKTGIISVASNHGTYTNIPIDAYGDEKGVTMNGVGSYGRVSFSGIAKGKKEGDKYSGTWEVELVRDEGRARTYSGKWKGKGNYADKCKIDTCK
jgi:hypothetical protein